MIGYYNYTVILTYLGLASGVTGIFNAIYAIFEFSSVICGTYTGFCRHCKAYFNKERICDVF